MPLYEYRCEDCQQTSTALVYAWSDQAGRQCSKCGGARLTRLVSRFSFHRSWGDSLGWSPSGETLTDVNEDDPHSVDQFMGRVKQEMGGQVTPDFDQMRRELSIGPHSSDHAHTHIHEHDQD